MVERKNLTYTAQVRSVSLGIPFNGGRRLASFRLRTNLPAIDCLYFANKGLPSSKRYNYTMLEYIKVLDKKPELV